jgi:LuxR family transcriptional regulator, maltose regulon positive regulatory protein
VLEPLPVGREPSELLSRRELEVLEMAALGLTNMEIAGRLSVTIHAVKFHLAAVYRKLGVSNRTEAVVAFLRAAPRQATSGNGS